LKVESR